MEQLKRDLKRIHGWEFAEEKKITGTAGGREVCFERGLEDLMGDYLRRLRDEEKIRVEKDAIRSNAEIRNRFFVELKRMALNAISDFHMRLLRQRERVKESNVKLHGGKENTVRLVITVARKPGTG